MKEKKKHLEQHNQRTPAQSVASGPHGEGKVLITYIQTDCPVRSPICYNTVSPGSISQLRKKGPQIQGQVERDPSLIAVKDTASMGLSCFQEIRPPIARTIRRRYDENDDV